METTPHRCLLPACTFSCQHTSDNGTPDIWKVHWKKHLTDATSLVCTFSCQGTLENCTPDICKVSHYGQLIMPTGKVHLHTGEHDWLIDPPLLGNPYYHGQSTILWKCILSTIWAMLLWWFNHSQENCLPARNLPSTPAWEWGDNKIYSSKQNMYGCMQVYMKSQQ